MALCFSICGCPSWSSVHRCKSEVSFLLFFPLSCIQPKLSCIQAATVGWLYGFMVFLGQLTGCFCQGGISVHSSWIGELVDCTYSTFCLCTCFFLRLKEPVLRCVLDLWFMVVWWGIWLDLNKANVSNTVVENVTWILVWSLEESWLSS